MTNSLNLSKEARAFTDDLATALNSTVTVGATISSVQLSGRDLVYAGNHVTKSDPAPRQGMRLNRPAGTKSFRPPPLYLQVYYRLTADAAQQYLQVQSSVFVLALDEGLAQELIHLDYEREKEGYPESHLQVHARSDAWDRVLGTDKQLHHLHLPLGGRRFRPTLEDFIEFLVLEGLAECHSDGGLAALDGSRESFRRSQLRAAIRNDPETALDVLRELGQL